MIGPMPCPTEPQIVSHLVRSLTGGTIMPHYTPANWWECDVAHFSDAGYLTEYEIKLSLSDFRADARKSKALGRFRTEVRKYDLIPDGGGPKRFWYVCPCNLIDVEQLPDFAGLMYVEWIKPYSGGQPWIVPWVLKTRCIKDAPILKGKKYGEQVIGHCRGVAYYRYLNGLMCQAQSRA